MSAPVSHWAHEADDLARGLGGGMLFGIPLLYTVEVWWLGATSKPAHMLAAVAAAYFPVALLIRSSGFRQEKDVRLRDALRDAVEAVALGVVGAAAVLFVIGEIGPGIPLGEAVGKLAYEAVPFSIGVAVACHIFGGSRDNDDDESDDDDRGSDVGSETRSPGQATSADLGATIVGAVFVAFNIAPTEEIPILAAATTMPRLLGVVALSLAASYVIVFVAGFGDQPGRRGQQGVFQHPATETVASYLVALLATLAMLVFFQRLDSPLLSEATLSQVLLLGLPAAVGGAAGRLAV